MRDITMNGTKDQNIRIFTPLLTDLYQITMAYAYWKSHCKDKIAVFDLYFRKNPFGGEYTIFSGLNDCIKLLENFYFDDEDIIYLKNTLPSYIDQGFYEYLKNISTLNLTLSAIPEGTVVFPKIPLLSLEGPLPIVQLLETSLLTFVNYASLVTTNAARYKIAAGKNKRLLEFGLRRAQGPDGGLSASKYCYTGGFDATSNTLAGKMFGIPVDGTHSHAFVSSYLNPNDLKEMTIINKVTQEIIIDFPDKCLQWRLAVCETLFPQMFDNDSESSQTNLGELTAFISYALSFPDHFLALVDTYDTMKSGIPNFIAVALALNDIGYKAMGIRIDSGDLAYLSTQARLQFKRTAEKFNIPWFKYVKIVASNDLNEETLYALNEQGNEVDCYGIGTHLVTCQRQPALGCVYKSLGEANNLRVLRESHYFVHTPPSMAINHFDDDDYLLFGDLSVATNKRGSKTTTSPGRTKTSNHLDSHKLLTDNYHNISNNNNANHQPSSSHVRNGMGIQNVNHNLTLTPPSSPSEQTSLAKPTQGATSSMVDDKSLVYRHPPSHVSAQLVEVEGKPRMKLSQDVDKMSMPGKKNVYRLYGKDDKAILDLIQLSSESPPEENVKILCRHPFSTTLRTYVNPSKVEPLMKVYWKNGKVADTLPTLHEIRDRVRDNLDTLRADHKRHLNPTPYKVSVSDALFNYIHKLWEESAPIGELS